MPLNASRFADPVRTQWFITVVVLATFGLYLAYFMQHERTLTQDRERDRLLTQIRVIDANLTQQLIGVNAAMLSLRPQTLVSALDTRRNQERSATMRALSDAMPAVRTLQMLEAQGLVVSSSRPETLGFNASQRAYFLMPKKQPNADTLYVSAPFTTSLGANGINMAKAWVDDNHLLQGVTTATLDPEYFNVLLRSVMYADDMRATLVHGDGIAFLTLPANMTIQGANLKAPGSLFAQHLASGRTESFFVSRVALTDDQRMVAYRTVSPADLHMDKPLMLAVSRDLSAVLAPWRQLSWVLGGTYALVCCLVLGSVYFLQRKQTALQRIMDASAREAQEQAERLELALSGGNLGLFDLDLATGIRQVNARAQEMVGDSAEDPVDTLAGWGKRMHPDDRNNAQTLRLAHEQGQTDALAIDYRIRHKDGHWVWIHSRSRVTQHSTNGAPLRMVGTYTDITDRLNAERALKAERMRLAHIIAGTNAGTWEHDFVTGEDRINDKYASMLGFRTEEMARKIAGNFENIVHPDDQPRVGALWNAHLHGATATYEAEFRVQHKAGHWNWILSHGKVGERDKDGKALNISGIHLDISAIRTAEAKLKELNEQLELRVAERTAELENTLQLLRDSQQSLANSEARATLSTLIAGLSHELGAPLGNSLIAASTVSAETRNFHKRLTGGEIKRSDMNHFMDALGQGAALMESNLHRANELLKNFRQVAADQASEQRRSFDLAQAVQEIVQTLSPSLKRHAHRITLDIPAGITMDSQPGPLGQVIINLVNNAYLHAFEGMTEGELTVHARADADWVDLEVRDNGVGIPPENLEKLFEPFFSTKIGKGGTGLGMAIVKNLVTKALGGSVAVRSTVGQGTVFAIRLPRALPAA